MVNRILLITNDPRDANTLKDVLGNAKDGPYEIEWMARLSTGLERLRTGGIDAIIVDLSLPDSSGIGTFDQLFAAAPHTPIMTLSTAEDESLAIEAVQRGAQGYLSKDYFESNLVSQALRNIIQRKTVEEAFYKEKARAEIALNSISDAVICTDLSGNIDYLNIAAEKMTGWSREDARGRPIAEVFKLINGVTREPTPNPVDLVLQLDQPMGLNADTVLIRRDGSEAPIEDSASPIHDWNGQLTGVVIVFHDVSAAHAMTKKMAHLAQHDFLTNLPNRLLLNDRIAQAIALAKRRGTQLAVLFLDLDNFKHTNDSLGHATGDKLLQSVTQRLIGCVRSSDTVSRQGGDEFVILLTEGRDEHNAALTADKILGALAFPHSIAKRNLHVTTSIGISVYPADGQDAETLIKNADTAMYHAKEKGRNNYQFFRNDMNIRAVERQFIEANLRRALEKQEFVLHYQPKVNLDTGAITGAEALLRWVHADWGMVLPGRFVPVAEDCGLIVPIGRWVLREACTQVKRWLDAGLVPGSIAINISALEFRQNNFFEGVRAILNDTGLEAPCLQLEITESVLMDDAESSISILQQLKDMGVLLAMDDFGTGYSSLSYLKQFPIDVLKIDQSFVHDIGSAADNGAIVSAVIGMGNSLNLRVVAEGIETQDQLAFLKARHCEEGQGYFFSQPLVAEQFAALLAAGMVETVGD
jgi:diguanylate cyclase (GGDEF)-like protein/PAS domain S-box-containing protein